MPKFKKKKKRKEKIVSNGCMSHVFPLHFSSVFLADPHVSGLPRGMDRHYVGVNTLERVEEMRPAYVSQSMHHA